VTRFSVVIPVKDGQRYLAELLAALEREGPDEVLVIDSGSRDGSVRIARAAGVNVLEIGASDFGHGRTRNLGAEHTSGELICFLTQDATPCPGWLAAYREAFALDERAGVAFGPHLPRPDTSPMIARELEEFFAGFAPDGQPQIQRPAQQPFLSNVNSCYLRACWEEVRFRDVDYAEDQAFGADLARSEWLKVFHPGASVLHAHDYGWSGFMRRYFDEYRALRATTGHVERLGVRSTVRYASRNVGRDREWMAARGMGGATGLGWAARSAVHHSGRRVFSALGSRSDRLPPAARRALSLEESRGAAAAASSRPVTKPIPPTIVEPDYVTAMRVIREGPAPLLDTGDGASDRSRLRIAMVIPPFSLGSGGHNTLFQILMRLERRGHVCSVWLQDYQRRAAGMGPGHLRHHIREYFAPIEAPVYNGFAEWHGADIVAATGWQTVHPVLSLPGAHARAYIVNDHEPDFFEASVERTLAEDTYRHGLHCIAASPWLRDLLISRYGGSADAFQLGVDHDVYRPRTVTRHRDLVIYYARHSTPRRAVPIGLLALTELYRRRPDLRIVLFGSDRHVPTAFPYEHAGVLPGDRLSLLYSEATAGLCLSLTNFSLMPKEMLACGLPCVELAGVSAESIFGEDGPIELAQLDPIAIADALEKLLDDHQLWERRSREGVEFVSTHTWERAADEVEAGLRHALRLREHAQPLERFAAR
jgi:glycosyltransferase involved in cell wall biosynthesis/GT2 family glycosyltransferase